MTKTRSIIENEYLAKDTYANVPAIGANLGTSATGKGPGHMIRSLGTGRLFENVGLVGDAIYTDHFTRRYFLEERFQKKPALNPVLDTTGASSSAALIAYTIANKDFEANGTNATTATVSFAAGGGITLTTTTTSGDQVIIEPHQDTNQSAWLATSWLPSDEPSFETVITTSSATTLATIWAGFKLASGNYTSVTATDDDQAFFRVNIAASIAAGTNSGKFQCIDSTGGSDNAQDSGVLYAPSTSYHLLIRVGTDGIPRYYINHLLVATGNALTASAAFSPCVGVQTGTTAARAITLRGIRCEKTYA